MNGQSPRSAGHYNGVAAAPAHGRTASALPGDDVLVDALQAGDLDMFSLVVDHYHRSLLRVATTWVRSPEAAEEAVQDTWLAVLKGLPRFERRASFKTWLFRILANRSRTRAVRDGRLVPGALEGVGPARDVDLRPVQAQLARGLALLLACGRGARVGLVDERVAFGLFDLSSFLDLFEDWVFGAFAVDEVLGGGDGRGGEGEQEGGSDQGRDGARHGRSFRWGFVGEGFGGNVAHGRGAGNSVLWRAARQ